MAAQMYSVIGGWSPEARYTALGETAVKINNPSITGHLSWTITTSDTAPTIPPGVCNLVAVSGTDRLTLQEGERLWLAWASGVAPGPASIEI